MDVATRLNYFHKEHQDFLRFLDDWEMALDLTASEKEEQRLQGIERLRELRPELQALRDHCTSEERNIEEPYRALLEKGQIDLLRAEHEELTRLLTNLFSELRFATIYETERARVAGLRVSAFTRRHISFEEKLLGEIENQLAQETEEKLLLRYTQASE